MSKTGYLLLSARPLLLFFSILSLGFIIVINRTNFSTYFYAAAAIPALPFFFYNKLKNLLIFIIYFVI